jgi:uncharacterized membrane protein YkoI
VNLALSRIAIALFASTAALFPAAGSAQRRVHHVPQVPIETARVTALTRVPGRIRHEELEYERHRWIYSFEIRTGHPGIEEVNIDADSGAIVSVEHERG